MQTTIKYQDTALPTSAADVTLFNSATSHVLHDDNAAAGPIDIVDVTT